MQNRMNNANSKTSKGYYTAINPAKYIGDLNNIQYMSSWEYDVNRFLDTNPNVLRWGSEIVVIDYFKRETGRMHKYYVDYYVKFKNTKDEIHEELWEVKPKHQMKKPRRTKKKKESTFIYETKQYEMNLDKWAAAEEFCKQKGIKFRILTEKEIFI